MFDVSLSVPATILILLSIVFVLSLFVVYLTESWTEIPGVNEPSTRRSEETLGLEDRDDATHIRVRMHKKDIALLLDSMKTR